jgi:hypothetical protein
LLVFKELNPLRDSEAPGIFDLNGFSWSEANAIVNPGFADPSNGNFSLLANSFLIDEGNASDSFVSEPAPNGGRINIGHHGGTTSAQVAPAGPAVSNVAAGQSGQDVSVTFDTTTSVEIVWVKLEYWNGSSYTPIPTGDISGSSYVHGYRAGRIAAGGSRTLIWEDAGTTLAGQAFVSRIRVTIEHGANSQAAVSSDFSIDYSPTATPTLTPVPTLTPTATLTPTQTPIETPPSAPPSPTAPATVTPVPTSAPPIVPTATPEPDERPFVQAFASRVKSGRPLLLSVIVNDDRSDVVDLKLSITLSNKRTFSKTVAVQLGPQAASRKKEEQSIVRFKIPKLSRKTYRYCLEAIDESGLTSEPSCARLKVN